MNPLKKHLTFLFCIKHNFKFVFLHIHIIQILMVPLISMCLVRFVLIGSAVFTFIKHKQTSPNINLYMQNNFKFRWACSEKKIINRKWNKRLKSTIFNWAIHHLKFWTPLLENFMRSYQIQISENDNINKLVLIFNTTLPKVFVTEPIIQ